MQDAEKLPDYSKVCFPNMSPVDFCYILPTADSEERAFIKLFLVLDPVKRMEAHSALSLPYFHTAPFAVDHSLLPIKHRDLERGKKLRQVLIDCREKFIDSARNFCESIP